MSKIKLEDPIKELRGKICKHSDTIYKQVYNTRFTSRICNPYKGDPTTAQLAGRTKFKSSITAVNAIMADADQRATALAEFKKQSKYPSLRGFLIAKEYAKL